MTVPNELTIMTTNEIAYNNVRIHTKKKKPKKKSKSILQQKSAVAWKINWTGYWPIKRKRVNNNNDLILHIFQSSE